MFHNSNKIYAIVDEETCQRKNVKVLDFVENLIEAEIGLIQYRNKIDNLNTVIIKFTQIINRINGRAKVIINDFPEIALESKTYLHLGQTDINKENYRLFGRSTHNMHEVIGAINENPQPDYIGFGAMFPSKTKPGIKSAINELEKVLKIWKKDIVLIGGINYENINNLPKGENIYYAIISDFFTDGTSVKAVLNRAKMLSNKSKLEQD